ncbi:MULTISPECIES: hypothetical protein [unclassified Methanoculleus]|jgi:hypothetical protein|uniref:hypothetical protein n=1 Tax=unclassified Methanoculleus TaxID=2619537 RepID=UPI0025DE5C18|nr:hypothetical protein [Methanoculleus sp. UBA377]MDD2472798.1 hypothetical protein [Methanoculleus sp.]
MQRTVAASVHGVHIEVIFLEHLNPGDIPQYIPLQSDGYRDDTTAIPDLLDAVAPKDPKT